ncbi:hypothetical protein CC80DRAFT_503621, partial [Byssothecium circinans]
MPITIEVRDVVRDNKGRIAIRKSNGKNSSKGKKKDMEQSKAKDGRGAREMTSNRPYESQRHQYHSYFMANNEGSEWGEEDEPETFPCDSASEIGSSLRHSLDVRRSIIRNLRAQINDEMSTQFKEQESEDTKKKPGYQGSISSNSRTAPKPKPKASVVSRTSQLSEANLAKINAAPVPKDTIAAVNADNGSRTGSKSKREATPQEEEPTMARQVEQLLDENRPRAASKVGSSASKSRSTTGRNVPHTSSSTVSEQINESDSVVSSKSRSTTSQN